VCLWDRYKHGEVKACEVPHSITGSNWVTFLNLPKPLLCFNPTKVSRRNTEASSFWEAEETREARDKPLEERQRQEANRE
jgi:hypothetical protein